MKKKVVLAMLVMCLALSAAACGNENGTASSQTDAADNSAQDEEAEAGGGAEDTEENSGDAEKQSEGTRLVSVKDVSEYVTIGEYKGLTLDNVVQPGSDDDVELEISYQLQDSSQEVKDGTLAQGDTATVNFTATINGESFEGSAEEDYEFVVGESGLAEGFDEGLTGMKKGETRELNITFPSDYYDDNVAGQTAVYEVTLQKFTRSPELTDD